jgi:hypothetical protein
MEFAIGVQQHCVKWRGEGKRERYRYLRRLQTILQKLRRV